jgi:peptide/nickel transport system permease protein
MDLLHFVGRRALQFIPVILLATFIVFGLIQLIPGDIAVTLAGENASAERVEEIRELYNLNRPFFTRYTDWLTHVASGDLSQSMLASKPALTLILERFPATLLVVAGAVLLSLLIGIPLGVSAAVRAHGPFDRAVMAFSSVGVALPNFWLAMILVYWLALTLHWLPATGMPSIAQSPYDAILHAILPAMALGASGVAEVSRQVRSSLVEVLASDYVRTLHAKGLARWRILWQHGLKNIGVTLITIVGLLINRLLGATVVVEAVFAIPGIGSLLVYSAINKDFAVIQGIALVLVLIVILINLATDILYFALDPRMKHKA